MAGPMAHVLVVKSRIEFGIVSLHRFDRYLTYLLYQKYPLLPPYGLTFDSLLDF